MRNMTSLQTPYVHTVSFSLPAKCTDLLAQKAIFYFFLLNVQFLATPFVIPGFYIFLLYP